MVSGEFLCARAGKLTEAMEGITHRAVARRLPPQFEDCYKTVTALRGSTQDELAAAVLKTPGDLIHVHNEPNWPVSAIKAVDSRPVIMNVHDVTSARPYQHFDPYEMQAYLDADAFIFVSEEQRDFVIANVCDISSKPYCCIGNFGSHSTIIERCVLPHIGGLVYEGGADPRGAAEPWRDQSPIADAVKDFHIYPGNPGLDYSILHDTVLDYRLLTHRLAQHDWGYVGVPVPNEAWAHSLPNKTNEYFMAGIPIIALNAPLLKPLCDSGLGIYCHTVADVARAAKENPKPYAKVVKSRRHQFTMRYNIEPVLELYKQVTL